MLEDFPLASVLMSMPGIGIPPRSAREVPPDRRPDPPEHRRRDRLRGPSPPRGICQNRAGHAKIRHLDPRRVPRPLREQTPEERAVLLRLGRHPLRPDLQGLLRSQTCRRQASQRCRDLPGPPPLQRHLRDAPRRHLLPAPDHHPIARAGRSRGLTRSIGTRYFVSTPDRRESQARVARELERPR